MSNTRKRRPPSLPDDLFDETGVADLPNNLREDLLQRFIVELEWRVGQQIAEMMDDTQLDEFAELASAGDEAASIEWLSVQIPNHRDITAREFDKLKGEANLHVAEFLRRVQGEHHLSQREAS